MRARLNPCEASTSGNAQMVLLRQHNLCTRSRNGRIVKCQVNSSRDNSRRPSGAGRLSSVGAEVNTQDHFDACVHLYSLTDINHLSSGIAHVRVS